MIAVRNYKKALFVLPVASFAVAALIHLGATFGGSSPTSYSSKTYDGRSDLAESRYPVLRNSFERRDPDCRKPIIYSYLASGINAKSTAIMSDFLGAEILPGAKASKLDVHAFFLSPDGTVPAQLHGFQHLNARIPSGIGMITATPAGLTFPPGSEASARVWLAAVSQGLEAPDSAGMFGIVIEPPRGGCGAIK